MKCYFPLSLPIACALSAVAPTVLAADYYVDTANAAAADTNPGTAAAPWKTIQHGADIAVAGDTVHVAAGTYVERVVPKNSGEPNKKITFVAEPARQVKMHGFATGKCHYLRIEGFAITNSEQFTGWDETQGVFLQSNYVEVVNNYFHDMSGTAIVGYWHEPFPESATITGNTINAIQAGIMVQGKAWVVENNEISRLIMHPDGGDCDYSRLFGDDHIVRTNYFHGTDFNEVGSAHVDCFQTFDNNGEHLNNVLIDGNTCFDFHQAFMGEASFHQLSSNITFRNNVFARGQAWGLCVHQIKNIVAINNTFADIQYHGMGFRDGSTGNISRNNIFYNVETSYWASDGGEVTGDYNLIFNSKAPDTPGAHDILNADPLFVNAAAFDYHLQAGSPAIDKAEAQTDFANDHDGTARPQGAGWDIGAFEFCAAGTCAGGAGASGAGGSGGGSGTGGAAGSGVGGSSSGGKAGAGASGPTDSGTGASGAGGGGVTADGGTEAGANAAAESDDGGCGCRIRSGDQPGTGVLLSVLAAIAVWCGRHRRRTATPNS